MEDGPHSDRLTTWQAWEPRRSRDRLRGERTPRRPMFHGRFVSKELPLGIREHVLEECDRRFLTRCLRGEQERLRPTREAPENDVTSLRVQFEHLKDTWATDCLFISDTSARIAHPAYRAIVALGAPVVSLLIEDLGSTPDWAIALRQITGEDPTGEEAWGDARKQSDAWHAWASRRSK